MIRKIGIGASTNAFGFALSLSSRETSLWFADRAQEEGNAMHVPKNAMLLRIFVGEDQRYHTHPLYESIVLKARELHLAGATVLRGPMGFGHSSKLHSTKILNISEDLPIVIEIVDSEQKIDTFLPVVDEMIGSGLVTLEKVQVLAYGETRIEDTRV
jgi:PII-like signaling protein